MKRRCYLRVLSEVLLLWSKQNTTNVKALQQQYKKTLLGIKTILIN